MQPAAPHTDDPAIAQVVREYADRHGVPRRVALAFAWLESRLNPLCEGDLDWPTKRGGELYTRHVANNPKFRFNEWRDTPAVWHSYGLFQLLACYHALPAESPMVLLRPDVNADRGCAEIQRLLHITRGDVRAARLAYVGCGTTGEQCASIVQDAYVNKLTAALERYQTEQA